MREAGCAVIFERSYGAITPSDGYAIDGGVKGGLNVHFAVAYKERVFFIYAERGKLKTVENQPTISATTAEIKKALGI